MKRFTVPSAELAAMMTLNGIKLGPASPLIVLARPKQRRGRPEDDHQRSFIQPTYSFAGFVVNVLSSRRHAKGVTAGVPDLYCQRHHPRQHLLVWHESKWDTRQSAAQYDFMLREQEIGKTFYVLGRAEDAAHFLSFVGIGTTSRARLVEVVTTPTEWHASVIFQEQLEAWGYRAPRRRQKRTLVSG